MLHKYLLISLILICHITYGYTSISSTKSLKSSAIVGKTKDKIYIFFYYVMRWITNLLINIRFDIS